MKKLFAKFKKANKTKMSVITGFVLIAAALVLILIQTVMDKQNETGASSTGSNVISYAQKSYSKPEQSKSTAPALSEDDASTESDVRNAAESFLFAYYHFDTSGDRDEYIQSMEKLVTTNGLNNMRDNFQRPGGKDPVVRIEREMIACKPYIYTKGKKDVTAFCVAAVKQGLFVNKDEPVFTNDHILIKLELKLEDDNAWRVNAISLERSLSTLTMDYAELF